jgi:hypothetical protein
VHVLFGGSAGLTSSKSQMWSENSAGIPGSAGEQEHFGYSMVAANFGRDAHADLALTSSGGVLVLYGTKSGPTSVGCQRWSQNSAGIKGVSERLDFSATHLRRPIWAVVHTRTLPWGPGASLSAVATPLVRSM